MTVLTCSCPRCDEIVRVPVDSLLVAVTAGATDPGRLAYICPACDTLVDERLPLSGLSILLAAGSSPLVVVSESSNNA
jgi:hypothetical protein